MPNISNSEIIEDGLQIAVRSYEGKGGITQKWMSIHYAGKGKQRWKSLKLNYDGGEYTKKEAVRRAKEYHAIFKADARAGKVEPSKPYKFQASFHNIANEYLKDFLEKVKENEKLARSGVRKDQLIEVVHGKGYYSLDRYKLAEQFLEKIYPFFYELDTDNIQKIKPLQLNSFSSWAFKKYQWAPASVCRAITTIRHVYFYAFDREIIDKVPSIARPKENLRARRRRCFKRNEYIKFIKTIEDNYKEYKEEKDQRKKDRLFQFLCFCQFIAFMGFRPPTGRVKKNLLRWENYQITKKGTPEEVRVFERIDEKNHTYKCVIMKEIWPLWDALEALYKKRGVSSPYVFAYTEDFMGMKKGEPILNFRKYWKTYLRASGLDGGEERSERLAPYSLRSFFITMRLSDGDVDIYRLAKIVGSSIRMIQIAYDDFQAEEEFQKLTKGAEEWGYTAKYDTNGNLIL